VLAIAARTRGLRQKGQHWARRRAKGFASRRARCDAVVKEEVRARGDEGLGLRAGFIGARRLGVWQAGMRRCIGLGLVLESRLPTRKRDWADQQDP
jgi:hypothetical protein